MKRKIYTKILKWKDSSRRQPLLLQGARQVGKSYILEQFGMNEFKSFFIFNFEQDKRLSVFFDKELDPVKILSDLSIHIGKNIDPLTDLVIFDEIQECPRALTSLKYFCEKMPRLALCCAGSLLGVSLSSESFPVGKVDFKNLHPMNFEEFLMAMDEEILLDIMSNAIQNRELPESAHFRIWDRLKEYYITGGMPRVIQTYSEMKENKLEALNEVRRLQRDIIDGYIKDFAKHSGKVNSMHINTVYENIPMQLSQNINGSVKRYQFKDVVPGKKRYSELQGPIEWLEKAGLIIKVKVNNRAELPLENFCKGNLFKLYMGDIGLLGCSLDLPVESILQQDYGITKGYFAENFVAQEFMASGLQKFYSWTERTAEIEFLRVIEGAIVPIEVKAGLLTKAKSLRSYIEKYSPVRAVKLTGRPIKKNDPVIENIPVYLAGKL